MSYYILKIKCRGKMSLILIYQLHSYFRALVKNKKKFLYNYQKTYDGLFNRISGIHWICFETTSDTNIALTSSSLSAVFWFSQILQRIALSGFPCFPIFFLRIVCIFPTVFSFHFCFLQNISVGCLLQTYHFI